MITTPAMGLTAWNSETDVYSSDQLAINWTKVDQHDHSPGKGLTIPTAGIADQAITADKFAPGAFDSLSVPNNSVGTLQLVDGSVTTIKLADGAVTTVKIGSGQVTGPKIANNAVDTAQINASAVGSAEIATNAVTASEILAGAVGTSELANDAVTNAKIADDAVNTTQIADNAVNLDKLTLGLPNDQFATTTTGAGTQTIASVTVSDGVYMVFGLIHVESTGSSTNVHTILTFNSTDHESDDILVGDTTDLIIPVLTAVTITTGTTLALKLKKVGSGGYTIRGVDTDYPGSRLTVLKISN